MIGDPVIITGCGHEPKDGFEYPVFSHVRAEDCGFRLSARILDKNGQTRLVQISCARFLELVAETVNG